MHEIRTTASVRSNSASIDCLGRLLNYVRKRAYLSVRTIITFVRTDQLQWGTFVRASAQQRKRPVVSMGHCMHWTVLGIVSSLLAHGGTQR